MRKIFTIITVFLFVFSSSNISFSSDFNERISEMNRWVHPRLDFKITYDDNIFYEPSNEKDDWIFTVSPGFLVNIPFSGDAHLLTLDYHTDLTAFVEYGDQNYAAHYLLTNLDLNFPRFYIKTYDDFRLTNLRSDTEFTERIERFENLFSFDLGSKELNKLSFLAGYDYYLVSYRENQFDALDRDDHTLNAFAYYQIFPKSKALIEYNHSFIDYDNDVTRDGDYDQVRVGLEGELFQKLVGIVKVGYQNRRYDDSTQDWENAVVFLSLVEHFSPHTALSVSYERTARESVYENNNYYSVDLVSVTLNQALFFERLDGRIEFYFQNNGYDVVSTEGAVTQERDDDIIGIEVGIDYAFRGDWLLTSLEYSHTERDSNFNDFDYGDNKVTWKISALF